jgi:two-component system, cell cycle sensor histidine kinase and response regulator CckA
MTSRRGFSTARPAALWLGPACTLAGAVLLAFLPQAVRPSGPLLLLLGVAYSALRGGSRPALASALIVCVFSGWFIGTSGHSAYAAGLPFLQLVSFGVLLPIGVAFAGCRIAARLAAERAERAALERALEASRHAERHLGLLADAGHLLQRSLDLDTTLEGIARIGLGTLADCCIVDLVMPDDRLRRVAVVHADPARQADADQWREMGPDQASVGGMLAKLRSGRAVLADDTSAELMRRPGLDPARSEPVRRLDFHSCMVVPLQSRGEVLGLLTIMSSRPGQHFSQDDQESAIELGRRAGSAVDNARLYAAGQEALRREAETRALLETVLAGAPVDLSVLDRDLRYVRVSDAQAARNGRPAAEHIGRSLAEVTTRGASVLEPFFRRVFQSGEPLLGLDLRDETPEGLPRHLLASFHPIRDGAGEIQWVGSVVVDLTERVRAEQERAEIVRALEESEARFQAVATSGVLGILVADPERILEANDAFLALLGYTREEMLSGLIRWPEITPGEYATQDELVLRRLLETGVCPPFEKEYIRKDGTRVPILIGGAVTSRTPLEWACFVLDTSGLRRAEGEVREREELLRLVTDAVPARISYVDANGRFRFVNRAYELWFGRPREEMEGRSVRELVGDTLYELARHHMQRALAGEVVDYELLVPHADGGLRTVSVSYVPDVAADGTVRGFVSLVTDLSERVRAERERQKLVSLVENAGDAIALAGLDGRMQYMNPAGRALVGLESAARLTETLLRDFWHEGTLPMVLDQATPRRLEAGALQFEGQLRHLRTGEPIEVWCNMFTVADPGTGEPLAVACVLRDIRAQKRSEAHLRQVQRMESVGLLAGGIAHNFNNTLMAVLGYNDYLLRALDRSDPRRQDAEEVRRAAGRAADLTRQLLAYSQRQILREEELDLNAVVREMERMLEPLIGADVALVTNLAPGLERVRADKGQLEQVILNLAVNAKDAMPRGGRLTIETADLVLDGTAAARHQGIDIVPGEYVMLVVGDTGHGMDPATRARLFEPFFTTKPPGQGTGLGLATVYGTVKQSGGFIWVYSEPGLGTTFRIYLPRAPRSAEVATTAESPLPLPYGNETVLLVEDEAVVRALARRTLELQGYTVLDAANGAAALQRMEEHGRPVHLLITDIIMPGMNGRELARLAVERQPGIAVIYMSGYTADDLVTRGLREAGAPFLQKPFLPDMLTRRVRDILDRTSAGTG